VQFGEPVSRIRAGVSPGPDIYGDPLPGVNVEDALDGAAFDPGDSSEPAQIGTARVVTTPKLYFYRGAPDILSSDLLRVRSDVYSVIGRPARWVSPFTGATFGLVVELKMVDG